MNFHAEIQTIKNLLTKAESNHDTWQAAGLKEKYLEAYFLVEALESHLKSRYDRQAADERSRRSALLRVGAGPSQLISAQPTAKNIPTALALSTTTSNSS